MKSITSRLNMFLAKIAGRNVDIGTLTPPVAVNATEELLLEIAERIGSSGGGGVLSCHATFIDDEYMKLDKTFKEIKDAAFDGKVVIVTSTFVNEYDSYYVESYFLSTILNDDGECSLTLFRPYDRNSLTLIAKTEDDYPAEDMTPA